MDRNPDEDLAWGLASIASRLPDYALWDRYIEGEQDMALTSKRWRSTFGHIASALVLNMCPSVISAVADRMGVQGFTAPDAPKRKRKPADDDTAPDAGTPGEDLAERATNSWGPPLALAEDQVTEDALTYGDGFMLVDIDPVTQKSTYWPQNPAQCAVRYSTERIGEVVVGIKVWAMEGGENKNKRYRANVYYGDFVFKYVTAGKHQSLPDKANKFVPFEEDDTFPVVENPTGQCQMFHFPAGGRIGQYGVSLLKIVKPVQDALNKQVLDIVVGSEYVALPQRWATGVGGSDDEQSKANGIDPITGVRKPRFRPGVDRMWTTTNNAAQFGEFPGADLGRLIPVADFYKVTCAQITGTPAYYLQLMGGEPPSGESLKVADARLVKRCRKLGGQWGNTFVMMLLTGFALEDGKALDITVATGLQCVWENPEVRNNREDAEVANLKQLAGVSKRRSLQEIGYTDDDIDEFEEERDEEAQAALAAGMASMAAAAAGGFPPVAPGERRQPPAFAGNGAAPPAG